MPQAVRKTFAESERKWSKFDSYFDVYQLVFESLRPDDILAEIGVANGGSAEAWAKLLGDPRRYVGVDLNPKIEQLADTLNIHTVVGDACGITTWQKIRSLGTLGAVVDDGGHTNAQQLRSILFGIDFVRPGGWVVVEDLHASFLRSFGNPRPTRPSKLLATLVEDFCRLNAAKPVRYPGLWHGYDQILTAPSIVAMRRKSRPDGGEVSGGVTADIMDHDWRWGGPKKVRSRRSISMSKLLPRIRDEADARRVLRQLRN